MVTCSLWCSLAARSISMRALGDTRTPSVSTTWPSTFTQPLSIQRSASRREHRPSSPMRLERRGCSAVSGDVGGRVMQKNRIVVSSQSTILSLALDARSVPYLTGQTIAKRMRWMKQIDRRISVAPMMDWTDRHCRYYLRGFAPDTLLYTEMITTGAVLRGDRDK